MQFCPGPQHHFPCPVLKSRCFVSSSSPSRFGISYDRQSLVDVQIRRSVQDEKGQPPVCHSAMYEFKASEDISFANTRNC